MLAASDAVHDRHRRAPPVGRPAGRREHHRGGPGVHVGGGARLVAVQDLRGEVARRAEQPPGLGQPWVLGDAGQAEVDQDRRASLHQDIGRLDVAVQDADAVHGLERLGERVGEVQEVAPLDGPLLLDVVVEREARDVAGDHERHRSVRVRVDDLGDPGAGDPAQRAHLAGQPLPGLGVADDVRTQHLQGDAAAVRPLGEVDHAHAALAQPGEQAVVADPHTGHTAERAAGDPTGRAGARRSR